jgi:hypothetical protein
MVVTLGWQRLRSENRCSKSFGGVTGAWVTVCAQSDRILSNALLQNRITDYRVPRYYGDYERGCRTAHRSRPL